MTTKFRHKAHLAHDLFSQLFQSKEFTILMFQVVYVLIKRLLKFNILIVVCSLNVAFEVYDKIYFKMFKPVTH